MTRSRFANFAVCKNDVNEIIMSPLQVGIAFVDLKRSDHF